MAELDPSVAAPGHGMPMSGARLREGLRTLVRNFRELAVPSDGRYVRAPALADERGVVSVPPPVGDLFPKVAAAVVLAAVAGGALIIVKRRRR